MTQKQNHKIKKTTRDKTHQTNKKLENTTQNKTNKEIEVKQNKSKHPQRKTKTSNNYLGKTTKSTRMIR